MLNKKLSLEKKSAMLRLLINKLHKVMQISIVQNVTIVKNVRTVKCAYIVLIAQTATIVLK